jgi:hypothetical protein
MPPRESSPNIPNDSSKHTLFLTILGLVLTAIGLIALIELFPRLSASGSSPSDTNDLLGSSRFTVSNDGYLKITDVVSACFLWKVELEGGGNGKAVVNGSLSRVVVPPESKLSPTEAITVPCTGPNLFGSTPPFRQWTLAHADLAIVVYYKMWPFTFYQDHRLFRFVARFSKEGEVVWEKQPAAALEPAFGHYIAQHGGVLPPPSRH